MYKMQTKRATALEYDKYVVYKMIPKMIPA